MSGRFSSLEKEQEETFDSSHNTTSRGGWDRRPAFTRHASSSTSITSTTSNTPLLPQLHSHPKVQLLNASASTSTPSGNGTGRCNKQFVEYDMVDLEKEPGRHIGFSRDSSSTASHPAHVCPHHHQHHTSSTGRLGLSRLHNLLLGARYRARRFGRRRTHFGRVSQRRRSFAAELEGRSDRDWDCECDCGSLDEKLSNLRPSYARIAGTHGRAPPFCARGTLVMIGSLVTFVLILYAWNVQVLWGGEMMRSGHGGLSMDRESHRTSGKVMQHMVHSHNDEMQGVNALTWALSLGVGSIEVDTWLSPASPPSSRSSAVSSMISRAFKSRSPSSIALGLFNSEDTLVATDLGTRVHLVQSEDLEKREATPDPGMVLLTGHKVKDLTKHTLQGLYLDPLLSRLEENNKDRRVGDKVVGLYKDDPKAETQLVIDMKSDGDMTWPYLMAALKPLLDKGYLTTYDSTSQTWNKSAIMVIGTGNTPIHRVYHQNPRIIFYDAPLKTLSKRVKIPASDAGPATTFDWDNTISPMASSKFPVTYHVALAMPPWNPIATKLKIYTQEAAKRGIASRWWGSTRKPGWARRRMWEVQKQGGVDWINADDLADAVKWVEEWNSR